MKVFISDTETSGLAKFDKPADDPTQPRIIQIGGILVDDRQDGYPLAPKQDVPNRDKVAAE